jgi:putative MATE family efflux protein
MRERIVVPKLGLLSLTWPMFIEELTGGITSFADIFFISMISDEAAASVGMLGPVLFLGYFILPQFTSAGTSVAAQYMGAKRHDRLVPAWVANILISTAIGTLLALVLFAFSGSVGLWLGMTGSQNSYAAQYLSVIAFNFILVGLRFSYSSILASQTLTRWNMVASVATNLLNIPLNWALMKGFWIIPAMGVRGIALATVISYFAGFSIIFCMVHFRLKISFFVKDLMGKVKEVVAPILKIGIPAALEPFSYTVQSFVVSILIIGLGTRAMGANTYVGKFMFLDMAVSWSLTMGGQILMSHHLGAGDIDQVKRSYWKIASITTSFAFVVFLAITIWSRFFLSFFTQDQAIIATAFWLFVIALFMEPIRSINILGGVALKTVGDGKFSVIMGLGFMWGLIPLILLSSALKLGIVGLWGCLLLDETIRAGINAWRWRSGRWIGKIVIGAPSQPAP